MDPTEREEFTREFSQCVECLGPRGYESEVVNYIKNELKRIADEIIIEPNFGNLYAKMNGNDPNAPSVMLVTHIDINGFEVINATDDGLVEFRALGDVDPGTLLSKPVTIHTKRGTTPGVLTFRPTGLRSVQDVGKGVTYEDLCIDIGASSREEVTDIGVQPGDPVTLYWPKQRLITIGDGKSVSGQGIDSRMQVFGIVKAMQIIKKEGGVDSTIWFSAETQGETLYLSSHYATLDRIRPDIALVCEAGFVQPLMDVHLVTTRTGGGPIFRTAMGIMSDTGGFIMRRRILDLMEETARECKVPYQVSVWGADQPGEMFNWVCVTPGWGPEGIPTAHIRFPLRYKHHASEVQYIEDYENALKVIVAFLRKIHAGIDLGSK